MPNSSSLKAGRIWSLCSLMLHPQGLQDDCSLQFLLLHLGCPLIHCLCESTCWSTLLAPPQFPPTSTSICCCSMPLHTHSPHYGTPQLQFQLHQVQWFGCTHVNAMEQYGCQRCLSQFVRHPVPLYSHVSIHSIYLLTVIHTLYRCQKDLKDPGCVQYIGCTCPGDPNKGISSGCVLWLVMRPYFFSFSLALSTSRLLFFMYLTPSFYLAPLALAPALAPLARPRS